jgi:uncharacterized membrane protein
MKKNIYIIFALVLVSFALSAYFYPALPDQIPSHWNYLGEVDGYMGKFWGLFLMPLIILAASVLFLYLPLIDPLKNNYSKFRKHYDGFIMVFVIFMLMVQAFTILWSLGYKVSPNYVFPIGLGLLFYYIGVVIENAKMNWFIGIRTPWTLSSEEIWDKTNKLGGKLFKISGAISVISILFGKYAFIVVMIPIIGSSIYTILYSYLEYKKLKNKKPND